MAPVDKSKKKLPSALELEATLEAAKRSILPQQVAPDVSAVAPNAPGINLNPDNTIGYNPAEIVGGLTGAAVQGVKDLGGGLENIVSSFKQGLNAPVRTNIEIPEKPIDELEAERTIRGAEGITPSTSMRPPTPTSFKFVTDFLDRLSEGGITPSEEQIIRALTLNPYKGAQENATLNTLLDNRSRAAANKADMAKAEMASKQTAYKIKNDLRKDFEQAAKPYRDQSQAFNKLENLAEKIPAGQLPTREQSIAIGYNFMKTLDPGSTVRESEFELQGNLGYLPGPVQKLFNEFIRGGSQLPAASIPDIIDRAKESMAATAADQGRLIQHYGDEAASIGLDPKEIIVQYGKPEYLNPEYFTTKTPGAPKNIIEKMTTPGKTSTKSGLSETEQTQYNNLTSMGGSITAAGKKRLAELEKKKGGK